jgi:hypothetical protein
MLKKKYTSSQIFIYTHVYLYHYQNILHVDHVLVTHEGGISYTYVYT